MVNAPNHRREQTGDALLDRIQANVRDLMSFVRGLAWLARRSFVALGTDITIAGSSAVYTTLLTTTLATTLSRGFLLITFTASGTHPTTANSTIYFKVLVDNVDVDGCYHTIGVLNSAFNVSVLTRVAVEKALHTITVQWSTDNNSARINGLSSINEHASLLVQESVA